MARGRKPKSAQQKSATSAAQSKETPVEVQNDVQVADAAEITNEEYIPPKKEVETTKEEFESRDRVYQMKDGQEPVAFYIKRKFLWFDEEAGYEREVMFTENQKTPFVDEFKGEVRPARPCFRNGVLKVPRNKVVWQKILSIYHPHVNRKYFEVDKRKEAISELDQMQLELKAQNLANSMDAKKAESIVRAHIGSRVSEMTSFEILKDLFVMAKENPQLVIDLENDDNIELRNIAAKAVEQSILKITADRRSVLWGANNQKLFNIKFDEHPLMSIVAWFKTDEGLDALARIEKLIK